MDLTGNFRCEECDTVTEISYEDLCSMWSRGYEKFTEEDKEEFNLQASITCKRGHIQHFNSPMFNYMFNEIFQEFRAL